MQAMGQTGRVRPRLHGDEGTGMIEYALLVSLIALVCVASLRFFQGTVNSKLSCSGSAIEYGTSTC